MPYKTANSQKSSLVPFGYIFPLPMFQSRKSDETLERHRIFSSSLTLSTLNLLNVLPRSAVLQSEFNFDINFDLQL